MEIDKDARKLDVFLANFSPTLTVADIKRFMPCTINVDPYLRKLIKGQSSLIETKPFKMDILC